jgi:hypothetical protein
MHTGVYTSEVRALIAIQAEPRAYEGNDDVQITVIIEVCPGTGNRSAAWKPFLRSSYERGI